MKAFFTGLMRLRRGPWELLATVLIAAGVVMLMHPFAMVLLLLLLVFPGLRRLSSHAQRWPPFRTLSYQRTLPWPVSLLVQRCSQSLVRFALATLRHHCNRYRPATRQPTTSKPQLPLRPSFR